MCETGVLLKLCLIGTATGIVVKLGDASASYKGSAAIASIQHASSSIPIAFVVRQIPILTTPRPPTLRPTHFNLWTDQPPLPYYSLSTSPPRLILRGGQLVTKLRQRLGAEQRHRPISQIPSIALKKVVQKEKNVAGEPGLDYPTYGEIPQTSFSCKDQRYKGFFGDPETRCQAWHYCDFNGGQASFLCPNGTIFSQVLLTCDWWFNVQCNSTAQQYVINERLYKYIIPLVPSFPEDFQGPEVNQYLTQKYMELVEKEQKKLKQKMKNEKEQNLDFGDKDDKLGDEAALNRQYLLQALSNDLETKEKLPASVRTSRRRWRASDTGTPFNRKETVKKEYWEESLATSKFARFSITVSPAVEHLNLIAKSNVWIVLTRD
ncbi:hypothetical protein J437_LFUL015301 [Ladona fulva]|uniref:Chitin-binding type-2 domain-containing protein n=1 Tax=Ladona fulva TaxID=123851 RepID=A0A8K0KGZ9_LADFU|nr:hypothetical protein J437_LFUL015301 [Ladona fulva]